MRPQVALLLPSCMILLVGCAHFRPAAPAAQSLPEPTESREQAIAADYEQRREAAELQAARARAEHGDLSGCNATIQGMLQRNPAHREARLLLADVQLARDNFAAAEQVLKGLVQDFPDDAAAHHALGLLYESTGRRDLARSHFSRAAAIAPDDPLIALSALDDPETTAKAVQLAATAGTVALAASPTPEAAAARAVIAAAQTPAGQQAIRDALELLNNADENGAIKALSEACNLESANTGLLLAAAVYLLRVEKPDAAIVLLEAGAERLPNSSAILRGLGAAYLQAGDLQAAQVVLQQAISLDSADALAYFLVGQVLQLQGRTNEAQQALRSAAQLDPRYGGQH